MQRLFRSQSDCPWCGEALAVPSVPAPILTRDWSSGSTQIHAYVPCPACRSLVLLHPPVAEQIGLYYPNAYTPYQAPPPHLLRPLALPQLEALHAAEQGGTAIRVLDYGPGSGFWLRQCQLTFPSAVLEAVDFDPEGTRERLSWLNAPVGLHTPEAFLASGQRWHLINFSHSLEHLENPVPVLQHAIAALEPGGLLVVHCPSARSLSLRSWGGFWQGLEAPRHLTIPASRVVERHLQRAGLQVVQRFSYGGPGSLRATLRAAAGEPRHGRRLGVRLRAALAGATARVWTFSKICGRLGLGTSFAVVARRPA